ncbi:MULTISPECIES: alpha/beta fold hydrolase [unclassified Frankia]|uniref:alpha/beta fold hydrolase n=1 Tax=unclassified Frankia TaxID=2632575 RepID=UPI00202541B3
MATVKLSDGVELFYEDRGNGRPIVFLHGWGTSGRVWEGQVATLHEQARCVTPDWRGCGRSDHPAHGNTVETVAGDILQLVDLLDLRDVVLVGSSLGGNIALEAALGSDGRIAALALLDAPQHFFADGVDKERFSAWHASMRTRRHDLFYEMVDTWFGPKAGQGVRRWTSEQLLRSGWFIDDLLADAATHDRRDQLGELPVPVLLLHGRLDREVPVTVPQAAEALLPNARLVVLEDCGHMPHLEDPARVSAELARFLEELSAKPEAAGR